MFVVVATFIGFQQYSCNDGYTLSGAERVRVCGGDGLSDVGEWSGEDYTCQA